MALFSSFGSMAETEEVVVYGRALDSFQGMERYAEEWDAWADAWDQVYDRMDERDEREEREEQKSQEQKQCELDRQASLSICLSTERALYALEALDCSNKNTHTITFGGWFNWSIQTPGYQSCMDTANAFRDAKLANCQTEHDVRNATTPC